MQSAHLVCEGSFSDVTRLERWDLEYDLVERVKCGAIGRGRRHCGDRDMASRGADRRGGPADSQLLAHDPKFKERFTMLRRMSASPGAAVDGAVNLLPNLADSIVDHRPHGP